MTDTRSQQREQQELLHTIKDRLTTSRAAYVELAYASPLDRIFIGFVSEQGINEISLDGSPEVAAELVKQAGFASYDDALLAFKHRVGETGKRFSTDSRLPELIGYVHPDEDKPFYDM